VRQQLWKKRLGLKPGGLSDGKNFFQFWFGTISAVPPDADGTEKIWFLGRRWCGKKKRNKIEEKV
jgi:hypothetical protein